MKKLKVSAKPEWLVKAIWRSTASLILVPARDEAEAKDRAWKRIARREGGDMCLEVKVIGLKK